VVSQFDKDDVEAIGPGRVRFSGVAHVDHSRLDDEIWWPVFGTRRSFATALFFGNHSGLIDRATYDLLKACNIHRGLPAGIARHQGFDPAFAAGHLRRRRGAGRTVPPRAAGIRHGGRFHSTGKHGRAKADYFIPSWKSRSSRLTVVIVYQEQVMQIAQIIGGYSLGGADIMRRAMGKKRR